MSTGPSITPTTPQKHLNTFIISNQFISQGLPLPLNSHESKAPIIKSILNIMWSNIHWLSAGSHPSSLIWNIHKTKHLIFNFLRQPGFNPVSPVTEHLSKHSVLNHSLWNGYIPPANGFLSRRKIIMKEKDKILKKNKKRGVFFNGAIIL